MKLEQPSRCKNQKGAKTFWAGLMLALFLGLQLAGISSAVHRWLHADSGSPGHQCAITLISQGQLLLTSGEASFQAPADFSAAMAVPQFSIFVAVDYRLLPGRAPPFLLT